MLMEVVKVVEVVRDGRGGGGKEEERKKRRGRRVPSLRRRASNCGSAPNLSAEGIDGC